MILWAREYAQALAEGKTDAIERLQKEWQERFRLGRGAKMHFVGAFDGRSLTIHCDAEGHHTFTLEPL